MEKSTAIERKDYVEILPKEMALDCKQAIKQHIKKYGDLRCLSPYYKYPNYCQLSKLPEYRYTHTDNPSLNLYVTGLSKTMLEKTSLALERYFPTCFLTFGGKRKEINISQLVFLFDEDEDKIVIVCSERIMYSELSTSEISFKKNKETGFVTLARGDNFFTLNFN